MELFLRREVSLKEHECKLEKSGGPTIATMQCQLSDQNLTSTAPYPVFELEPRRVVNFRQLADATSATSFRNEHCAIAFYKFLLCRLIAPACSVPDCPPNVQLLLVDDPDGEFAVQLRLFNYGVNLPGSGFPCTSLNDGIPVGSIIALMHPFLITLPHKFGIRGGCELVCTNPCHLVILGSEHSLLKSTKTIWKEALPYPNEVPFFDHLPVDVAGLKYHALRNYPMALECLTSAIKNGTGDARINFASRSAVYLDAGKPLQALKDAEQGLAISGESTRKNSNLLLRKALALFRSGQLEGCIKFIEENPTSGGAFSPDEYDFLLSAAKAALGETNTGRYDLERMKREAETTPYLTMHGDYFAGDLLMAYASLPCDDQGIAATVDIEPGTLLLASRAVAYAHVGSVPPHSGNFGIAELSAIFHAKLSTNEDQVINEIQYCRGQVTKPGEFLEAHVFIATDCRGRVNGAGIWSLPMLIGHSCVDHNCARSFIGDFMFVRATRKIKQGESLLFALTAPADSFSDRTELLSRCEIVCDCRLCKADQADPPEVRSTFDDLFSRYSSLNSIANGSKGELPTRQVNAFIDENYRALETAISLRSGDHQLLNMAAHKLRQNLALFYSAKKNYEKAAALVEKVVDVYEQLGLPLEVLRCADCLAWWYSKIPNQQQQSEKWQRKRGDLMAIVYGQ